MKEPNFLTLAEVIEIHHNQIQLYGGDLGVRDMRLFTVGGRATRSNVWRRLAVDGARHRDGGHTFLFLPLLTEFQIVKTALLCPAKSRYFIYYINNYIYFY